MTRNLFEEIGRLVGEQRREIDEQIASLAEQWKQTFETSWKDKAAEFEALMKRLIELPTEQERVALRELHVRADRRMIEFEREASDFLASLKQAIEAIEPPPAGKDGAPGRDGVDGKDGKDGLNGKDGVDGADGKDGKDGAAGRDGLNGKDGAPGADGKDGAPGLDGKDGAPGADGKDGRDGLDGKDGLNGKDGVDGTDGKDGLNGKDGLDGKDGAPGADGQNGKDGKDGSPGVDGRDGRDGGKGEKGDKGDPGLDGYSITPQGTWDAGKEYRIGDLVKLDGCSWIAHARTSTGEEPGKSDKWGILASRGKKGDKGETGKPGERGLPGKDGDPGRRGERGKPGVGISDIGIDGRQLRIATDDGVVHSLDLEPLFAQMTHEIIGMIR